MCYSIVLLKALHTQKPAKVCKTLHTQHDACWVAGADYPAAPAGGPPQSKNNLTTSSAGLLPTEPKPETSLLTEPQQQANLNMEKAFHAPTAAAKLKAVRLSLRAAYLSLQQAACNAPPAESNISR